jgi:hypothetical protein
MMEMVNLPIVSMVDSLKFLWIATLPLVARNDGIPTTTMQNNTSSFLSPFDTA